MKLAVLGGSGATGQELIKQALEQGHEVTALVRDPVSIPLKDPKLTLLPGQAMNPADVEKLLEGKDVVLSALGARNLGKTTIYSEPGKHIVAAMKKTGVKRFICLTSGGVEHDDPTSSLLYRWIFRPVFLSRVYDDCRRLEKLLNESDVTFIVVRPSQLTDGPRTGKYRVSPRFAPPLPKGRQPLISRADVADFMLKQLADDTYLRGTPTLAY